MTAVTTSSDAKLHITIYSYGPGTYTPQQKIGHFELRPTIPPPIVGNPALIHLWAQGLATEMVNDLKHSNQWDCQICRVKPAREQNFNIISFTEQSPPLTLIFIHNVCKASTNLCHRIVQGIARKAQAIAAEGASEPPIDFNPWTDFDTPPEKVSGLASSCAKCHDEKTGVRGYRMSRCSGCRLVRYCCPGCQKADWNRHKKVCRMVESVVWENFDE
ncbi:hypothetical protein D9611_006982 [Ephemerocybe angulata]|uniref:MYND-type domain-containing protein n=1 Tax=Ephemerocybe angulata TaxID=980116 RepID=A0A8H5B083_9AGAR|nr:hypothetical protein D9611_006982 [Tulosesus angulatus]